MKSSANNWAEMRIIRTAGEDIQAFAEHYGQTVSVDYIAVTERQIIEMYLPKGTAKPGGVETKKWQGVAGDLVSTVQAEAIPFPQLRTIVRDAIEAHREHWLKKHGITGNMLDAPIWGSIK